MNAWGVQIAGMNFQTRSNTGREKEQKWSLTDGKREQGKREEGKRGDKGGAFYYKQGVERHAWRRAGGAGMQAEPSGSGSGDNDPGFQQPELFRYVKERRIVPIGYCPIGSPSRPERDRTAEDVADTQMPEIVEIAKAHGVHPAIICIKWAVQNGQIPIPFSVKLSGRVRTDGKTCGIWAADPSYGCCRFNRPL